MISRRFVVDPEEIPTADAVAAAVVAAARVTGEDPLDVVQSKTGSRARYAALDALIAFYPLCPKSWLGGYVGGCDASNLKNQAKKALWWAESGQPAVDAAMAVLEGL